MLTGMGHPLLSNSHSIISNPKSLFNMNNYIHIIGDPSIEAYFRTFLQYAETMGFKLTEFEQTLRRKGLRLQGVFITINK